MVPGSRTEGVTGTHLLSAKVRKTIQSIKEIVGNHSDADIYVALKESNMDPNETTQKLLNQDPFHEVKRRKDRKKENQNVGSRVSGEPRRQHTENGAQGTQFHSPSEHNVGNKGSGEPRRQHTENGAQGTQFPNPSEHNVGNKGSGEPRRHPENGGQGTPFPTPAEHRVRRPNYSRNPLPSFSREFRVVKDNRVNHIYKEVKPPSQPHSTSTTEKLPANTSEKGSSTASTNSPSDSHARPSKDAATNASDKKITSEHKQGLVSNVSARVQPVKPNSVHQNSPTTASTSSVVGVYSSSTDPVHVPSPDSRSSGVVGAIRREVGVVGVRRQSSDHKAKQSVAPGGSSYANNSSILGKHSTSADSIQSAGVVQKTQQLSQSAVTEPSFPGMSVSRPSLNNQYNGRPHQQLVGHQRVSQHNKEWKPKSSQKTNSNNPGVIGTPKKTVSSPAENSKVIESDTAQLQDKLSQINIHENQNVIIAQHICVLETDRRKLTFGTIGVGTEVDSLKYQLIGATEKSNGELTASLTVPASELSTDDVSGTKQVNLQDDHVRSTDSESPASGVASEQQLPDNKESSSSQNLEHYGNIGLVRDTSPSFAPSQSQQQDSHDMPGFSAYDPPTGYNIPYFRPNMDESARAQVLSPPQEVLNSHHGANNVPTSTIAMMQQQQHQLAQMYPQVHLSHFANLMPYRQFLSPVYAPMAVPGYSNSAPYPHPSNSNSYVLMPGGGSNLNANNLKYGVQQFKPVPAGSPTGFGNFANPTGYAMLAPGVVGGSSAIEDSSRLKYKDNLYVPNPQGETSEVWLQNPRDLSGMQSTQYYNVPGQSPHAAPFMPSHTGHPSFNAVAAQSSHMQFPGMYHTPPQQAPMASPHHLGPAMGNNVGVGVAAAAPGAQVGAYQQPQLGHHNWTTNF